VLTHDLEDVREALALSPEIPLIACDARNPSSVARALMAVVEHTMKRAAGGRVPGVLARQIAQ
jgi:hypothetical protein